MDITLNNYSFKTIYRDNFKTRVLFEREYNDNLLTYLDEFKTRFASFEYGLITNGIEKILYIDFDISHLLDIKKILKKKD